MYRHTSGASTVIALVVFIIVIALTTSEVTIAQQSSGTMPALRNSGHVEAKGVNYYFEVYGEGEPLLLLHGGPEHIVEFYQLLGGGLRDAGWMRENMSRNRLAIIPNLTHYEIFISPELARTALPFLDGRTGAPTWSDHVHHDDE